MIARGVIKEAAGHGVRLWLDGEKVRLAAPTPPPPELLARLRERKAEIAALPRKGSPEPDETEFEERRGLDTDDVPEPISTLGRGCNAIRRWGRRMKNGGKLSMTPAAFSTKKLCSWRTILSEDQRGDQATPRC